MKNIEDYIDNLISEMDLDELIVWANNLGVEVNFPPTDDMYPDWENELAVEVGDALLKTISLKQYKQLQTEVASAKDMLEEVQEIYGKGFSNIKQRHLSIRIREFINNNEDLKPKSSSSED